MPAIDADFIDTAPHGTYIAALTSARRTVPHQPPRSTLRILTTDGRELGAWTLSPREFWVEDPESPITTLGTWHDRCYRRSTWRGASPTPRDFCF